jgi:chromosomal replication initiation ATPase DnaA
MSQTWKHEHVRALMHAAAYSYKVTVDDILTPTRRNRPIQRARWYAMALIKASYPGLSYPRIGLLFRRDHTTVMHGLSRYFGAKDLDRNTIRRGLEQEGNELRTSAAGIIRAYESRKAKQREEAAHVLAA